MTSEDGRTGDAGDGPTAEPKEGGKEVEPDDREASHLDDIEDGAGCTEIWERLSERRDE